jgi:hypothetical protein
MLVVLNIINDIFGNNVGVVHTDVISTLSHIQINPSVLSHIPNTVFLS